MKKPQKLFYVLPTYGDVKDNERLRIDYEKFEKLEKIAQVEGLNIQTHMEPTGNTEKHNLEFLKKDYEKGTTKVGKSFCRRSLRLIWAIFSILKNLHNKINYLSLWSKTSRGRAAGSSRGS